MKHFFRTWVALVGFAGALAAQPTGRIVLDDGHLDLAFDRTASGWSLAVKHDDFEEHFGFDDVVLHLGQGAFPNGHVVSARPAAAEWDFLGVAAGEPFWNAPAFRPISASGSARILEPGFSTEGTPTSQIALQVISDARITSQPRRWIQVELVGHRHWGDVAGHVSLWRAATNPIVHWSTALPPAGGNIWFIVAGAHDHMDWGVSHAGIHEIDLRATTVLNDGNNTPSTSETVTLTLVAGEMPGPYFWWAKDHFSPDEWRAGLAAPGRMAAAGGLTNLHAYALGLDPRSTQTVDLPGIRMSASARIFHFSRPSAAPAGVTLEVEYSENLASWTTLARSAGGSPFVVLVPGTVVQESAPAGGRTTIEVTAPPSAAPAGFFRLRARL
jgi:surface-anchored protein